MRASIIITSFNRPHLLSFGLESLASQEFSKDDVEIIVLNDGDIHDGTDGVCELYEDELNIKYFNAQHKTNWRVPGFAINFGVKKSKADVIFISCAEIYHLDNTVIPMIEAVEQSPKSLVIPTSGKDDDGSFLNKLQNSKKINNDNYNYLEPLNIHLPFFMAMKKCEFVNIGGYDEDFIGVGFDDNDIIDRLKKVGNRHKNISGRIIHLYHSRLHINNPKIKQLYDNNNKLYLKRQKGNPIRNINRVWGENF